MGELIEITPDRQKANSMHRMANTRLEMLSTMDTVKYPSLVIEGYYEVLKELITALTSLDGYKAKGEGAHKILIEYVGESYKNEFCEADIYLLDELRRIRNKINYDGFFVKEEYVARNKKIIFEIIRKLNEIIEKRI
ncbi:MAG: hypothetical protein KAI53_01920 [Candidatus Aenigmarchaeota archaeon]|nr:hypothetical protein [Candidatus Aenigmarchaeota archaeon]